MRRLLTATMLVAGALVGTSGLAAAQTSLGSGDDLLDDIFSDVFGGRGLGGDCGDLFSVADTDTRIRTDLRSDHRVDLDEDNVLLAIALSRNGVSNIEFEDVAEIDARRSIDVDASRDVDLDREDAFSLLALGGDLRGVDAACAADFDIDHRESVDVQTRVDLDDDEVLLAIALSNAIGGRIDFADIADTSNRIEVDFDRETDIDFDRDDALFLLALGGGR